MSHWSPIVRWRQIVSDYPRWIAFTILFHLLAVIFSVGYFSHDEHFRVTELVSLKMGIASPQDMTDEYLWRGASWLQPGCLTVIARALDTIGVHDPFVWAFFFRLVSAALNVAAFFVLIVASTIWFEKSVQVKQVMWLLCFTWFLPLIHARPSPENWGGAFLAMGIGWLAILNHRSPPPRQESY